MRIYERKNILERNINYSNAYGRNLLQEAIVSCEKKTFFGRMGWVNVLNYTIY